MRYVLRLFVLSILVFACMSAYSFLPSEWNSPLDLAALSEKDKGGRSPERFQIFITPPRPEEEAEQEDEPKTRNDFARVKEREQQQIDPDRTAGNRDPVKKLQQDPEKPDGKRDEQKQQAPPENRFHTIKKGDTLSRVIAKYYDLDYRDSGYRAMLKAIQAHNPGIDPKKLSIGRKIMLPPDAVKKQQTGSKKTKETKFRRYQVKPGDTLYSLAATIYNDGKKWRRLWELNRNVIKDYNKLGKGIVIRIPVE